MRQFESYYRLVWAVGLSVAAILSLVPGCDSAQAQSPRPRIVCTVGMVTDVIRKIVGEVADVQGVIGEGVDPHLFKPTRNDIAAMQSASVVVYSGLLLEGRMTETFENLAKNGKPVIAFTSALDAKQLLSSPESPGHHDPHVWMDVGAWRRCTMGAAGALGKWRPEHAAAFSARADAIGRELEKLDAYAKESIASIPAPSRVLITAHDAFGYFGRAYGLEVRGIQGISTESEAGLRDMEDLVRLIVERDIRAVFVESSVSEKNIRALLEGAKSKGKTVHIGGVLYSDAMGRAGTYEGTYVGMIDHNVTVITRALGGNAPRGGMQGKLTLAE